MPGFTRFAAVAALMLSGIGVFAQSGDKQGEQQLPRVPKEIIPAAPWLSPEEALKTFKIKDGFAVECIAHEPLVESPVALEFGPDGRIWICEMRGFMPNTEGKGEAEIPGRIVVLEDTDGDGRMDRKTVFLDNLVLPRALALARDGVLVGEPPHLWFCRDTNGDGKSDEKIEVASDFGDQKNPEHTANGLVRNIDNWTYNLYHTFRYRDDGTKFVRELNPQRTQWGLSHDDFGRLFFTSNSDQLRGDLVPSHYLASKPPGTKMPGVNVAVARDQWTWPGRINPGVNRAYQPGTLRDDYRLAKFTAACGTLIYRGDLLGSQFYGNAFVCEPSGNFIRRNLLLEQDGVVVATNAYDKDEFLISTDERFRPVNLYTGPDGALYVVDMYQGILQHRIYLTTYLRQQIESRGLDKPSQQGRIYRIAPASGKRPGRLQLAKEPSTSLVQWLSHANGWWRDIAQRLLVERQDPSVVGALKSLASPTTPSQASTPVSRLHALWTLEGMGKLDEATVEKSFGDPHPKVRAAAIRLTEPFLKSGGTAAENFRKRLLELKSDSAADVQIQLALTLGLDTPNDKAKEALTAIADASPFALARDVAKFGLGILPEPKKGTNVAQAKPLTAEEQKLFDNGRGIYEATCLACHQPHGMGQEGLAPGLVGTDWVAGPPERLIRIVLHGLRGPIKVKDQTYELDMPSLGILDDEQIAGVLTYVRREWGHTYSAVTPALVKQVREETAKREDAWTEPELLKIP